MLRMQRGYCAAIDNACGHNRMFIIDNSQPVIKKLDDISARKSAKSVSTFDFSTLYTSIPLDKLLTALSWVVRKSFRGAKPKQYITITESDAYFCSRRSTKHCCVTETDVINWIAFLINNTYFEVGNRVFLQRIGIPMGTDAAPYLANLFLYYYEFGFLEKK
jgi:hypothetical protein